MKKVLLIIMMSCLVIGLIGHLIVAFVLTG